jgi:hypothetical protein
MKHILMIALLSGIMITGYSQNFLFSPSIIQRELPLDVYSIDQIDITPLYPNDTAYLSYRLIENTCPSAWEFILCDWSDCFTSMPNTDDMHPLPDGYNALVKISAHPHQTEGNGYLHFWIFPTGSMQLHESIYFYYNTPNAAAVSHLNQAPIQYRIIQGDLHLSNAPLGRWEAFDLTGKLILSGNNATSDFTLSGINWTASPLILVWREKGELLKISPSH